MELTLEKVLQALFRSRSSQETEALSRTDDYWAKTAKQLILLQIIQGIATHLLAKTL
jgi:hypothetical protein